MSVARLDTLSCAASVCCIRSFTCFFDVMLGRPSLIAMLYKYLMYDVGTPHEFARSCDQTCGRALLPVETTGRHI
jgi:hypothetical protein